VQASRSGEGANVPGHLLLLRPSVLRACGAARSLHQKPVLPSLVPVVTPQAVQRLVTLFLVVFIFWP
jgi:hypothetical protein